MILRLIVSVNQEIELFNFDKTLMEKSIKKLENDRCKIDVVKIREIYNDAKKYHEELDKIFEDVVKFHNTMIEKS